MEFANFRDTPPAVRLAGRYVNSKGEPFMSKYDPMLENAPRGKIVEALYLEMQAGNEPITIEMTPESERTVSFLTQEYKDYFKAAREGKPPRVTISFQRLLGGVRFKPDASTELLGLYTAGESAGGFHGGDRLQSGAFLETQVFGRLAGQNAAAFAGTGARGVARAERLSLPLRLLVRDRLPHPDGTPARKVIETVQKIAWDHASILKDNPGLELALAKLADVRAQSHRRLSAAYLFEPFEAENLALVAEAIVRAAGQREETRATHRRRDFPNENPALARVHTRVRLLDGRLAADRVQAREAPRHAMT